MAIRISRCLCTVIEHVQIARPQRGDQDLLDVGEECRTGDGSIEHGRRHEPVETQARDHRVRLPVAARRVIVQTRAARTAAIASQQIGGDATLIEKDVLAHIAQRLPRPPLSPRRGDVRAPLLVGVYGFF